MVHDDRRRHGAIYSAIVSCAVILLAVPTLSLARAQQSPRSPIAARSGLKVLDLVVDQGLMETMRSRLTISDAQAAAMQRSFDAYWVQICEIDAHGYQRALDAGLREAESEFSTDPAAVAKRMQEMPSDAAAFDEEQRKRSLRLHDLRVKYTPLVRAAQRRADDALEAWMDELREQGVLRDESGLAAMRLVRRANYDFGGSWSKADFQKAPDVIALVEAASGQGQELESRRGDPSFEEAVASAIADYESRVDGWVRAHIAGARAPLRANDVPRMISSTDDPKEFEAAQREVCQIWRKRFSASHDAVEAIARHLDDAAAERWRDRFLAGTAPQLMADRLPDKLPRWLRGRSDATEEQVIAVQMLVRDWHDARDSIRHRAAAAGIAAKAVVQHLNTAPEPLPAALIEYASSLEALHEAARLAVSRFETIVDEKQRADFLRDFPNARP